MKEEIRIALANYMKSEGCDCCRDHALHEKYEGILGRLLDVPEYEDGSGYDFSKSSTD